MFSQKQLEPPSKKQLSYIESLERKTGLIFYGNTKLEAIKFIEKANQNITETNTIKRKIEREDKKFPFPKLADELPTQKQWEFIHLLEEKTMVKFTGVTRKEANDYIESTKGLLKQFNKKSPI